MLSKENIQEWMTHPVTAELRVVLKERIDEALHEIAFSDDPDYDRKLKGMIRGYIEVAEWQPEVMDAEFQSEVAGTPGSY